jgi:tetratricopeptide (TPR) repeat protein
MLHKNITIVLHSDEHSVTSYQSSANDSAVGLNAMRRVVRTSWLLIACICAPHCTSAQSQKSNNVISARELRIPPKALHAFEQGLELLAKKDPAGSLPHFQRAILEYAGYYEAYDKLGTANLKLWRLPEAEQAFRKSIDLSGGQFAHPLLALSAILDEHEKFGEAESVTRRGLDLDPDSWRGHYYLGLALFGLNRLVEAEESAHEALRLKTDFPEAHILLAEVHSREEDYPSLVNDLNEYLRLAPDGPASAGVKALRESAQGMMLRSQSTTALSQPQP